MVSFIGCSKEESSNQPPLAIAEENVIAGAKDGKLLLLINVFPNKAALDAMKAPDAALALTSTALNETLKRIFDGEYASNTQARIEFIELSSMNEYGDKDWSKMTKHGSILIGKKGDVIVVTENSVTYGGAKGAVGASMKKGQAPGVRPSQVKPSVLAQQGNPAKAISRKSEEGAFSDPYSSGALADRMTVRAEYPAEQGQIMKILRKRKSAEDTFEEIRPLYQKWAIDYQAVLKLIQKSGYRIVPYEEFDPAKLGEKICYVSHDVHWNDIAAAACMMDIENQNEVRSTYYIEWDIDPYDHSFLEDWITLKDLAGGKHRFGLHPAYSQEFVVWKQCPAEVAKDGDVQSINRFIQSDYPKICSPEKYVIQDSQWPETKVFAASEKVDNPLLKEMIDYERKNFFDQVAAMGSIFGKVESSADHGSAFRRAAADYSISRGMKPFDWSSSLFITDEMMKKSGIKVVRDKLHEAYKDDFPYVADNDPIFESFDKSLRAALERQKSFGMLMHPAVWMRTCMPEARLYDLGLPVEERDKVVERAKDLEAQSLDHLLKRTSREIVFQDLDLYDHSRYMGNTYPAFVPERVRRYNANYFLRSVKSDKGSARLDIHWGEVELTSPTGSVIYLPRDLAWKDALGISFKYRNLAEKGKAYLRVYRSPELCATVEEGEEGFPYGEPVDQWKQVVVPISKLNFVKTTPQSDAARQGGAMFALSKYYPADDSFFYAIELGISASKPQSKLWFSNICIHRPLAKGRTLVGKVEPTVPNQEIMINTPLDKFIVKTDSSGEFRLAIPRNANRYEIMTRYQGIWYAPTSGRFQQIEQRDDIENAYVPPARIVMDNTPPAHFAADLNFARCYYSVDTSYRYYPSQFFLYPGTPDAVKEKRQEFFIEFTSNSTGYIDRDRRPENPDMNYRVAILGPCYIAGHQISSQEHLAAVTESILRFRGRRVEVICAAHNTHLGFGSYAPFKNYILGLKPDLVVFNLVHPAQLKYFLTDLCAMDQGYDARHPIIYQMEYDAKTGRLMQIPNTSDALVMRSNAPKRLEGNPDFWGGVNWPDDWARVDRSKWPSRLTESFNVCQAGLKYMADECRHNGAKFGLLLGADDGTLQNEKYEKDGIQYDRSQWLTLMKESTDKADALLINGVARVPEFARDNVGDYLHHWKIDDHWTPAGHRAVAEVLADQIMAILRQRDIDSGIPVSSMDATPVPTPASSSLPPLPDSVFPILQEKLFVGQTAKIELQGKDLSGLEFEWHVKDATEWKSNGWSSSPSFNFTPSYPARWSIQVNIRRVNDAEPFQKKWLGQMDVVKQGD